MAKKLDPDRIQGPSAELRTGPGGLTMRQIHEQIKKSMLKDQQAALAQNKLTSKQSRWQRFVHYVWDKKGRT